MSEEVLHRAKLLAVAVLVTVFMSGVSAAVSRRVLPAYASYSQRVNAGGMSYTDDSGRPWSADQAYTAGGWGYVGGGAFSATNAIAGTQNDTLYQSNRNAMSGSFDYRFTIPNGTYNLLLRFAEIYQPNVVGSRVFDVAAEGRLVLDNFDIYAAAGTNYTAVDRNFVVTVNDGVLDVTFSPVVSRPAVNAIEVSEVMVFSTPADVSPTPILPLPTLPPVGDAVCTMVVAYSQVGVNGDCPGGCISGYGEGWYVAPNNGYNFENIVNDNSWQLLWYPGHGVDRWQDPAAPGWVSWNNTEYPFFSSACTVNSRIPDRIILSISGPYGTDVNAWRVNIEAAVTTIRQQLSSATQIVLIPVVGGPAHQTCNCTPAMFNTVQGCNYLDHDGNGVNDVRASWQHAYIDQAIQLVLQDISSGAYSPGVQVVSGVSPEVRTCDDYHDGLGHLTTSGAQAVGVTTAQYFVGDPGPTSTPVPTGVATPTSTPAPVPTATPVPRTPTPTPTPALVAVRSEVENMTMNTTNGYRARSGGFASGGALVNLYSSGGSYGTASGTFQGASGVYDIRVRYFDENDGTARLQVTVGGELVDSWELGESTSSNAPNSGNARTRSLGRRTVQEGTVILIEGFRGAGDNASIDYIELVPYSL